VASIFPRLADVISDTDKGKRSLRAKEFASGKPALDSQASDFIAAGSRNTADEYCKTDLIIVSLNARPGTLGRLLFEIAEDQRKICIKFIRNLVDASVSR
jgi:hypothetical protein